METIASQRVQDIVQAFFNGIKGLGMYSVTHEDVIRSIMSKGAPRFYVTPEKAKRYISIMDRGGKLTLTNPHRIAMYEEIFRRYKAYASEHNIKGYGIVEDIIHEPAPSYYISARTFRDIIYSYHKSRRKCRL